MEYWKKLKKLLSGAALTSIWRWSAGHRLGVLLLALCRMGEAGLSLAFTLATKEIIDSAVSGSRTATVRFGLALFAIICAQLALSFLLRRGRTRLRSGMLRDFRGRIICSTLALPYPALAQLPSGELTGRILSDTRTVADGILGMIPDMVSLGTQFVGAGAILLFLNRTFLFSLVGLGLLGALLSFFWSRRLKQLYKDTREREDLVQAALQETVQNLRITKASSLERQRTQHIRDNQERYVSAQVRQGDFTAAAGTIIHLVFRFSWLYAMLWGCAGIVSGTLSYGTLTAMLQLVAQVQSPISGFANLMSQGYAAVSSAERLEELVSQPPEETPRPISGSFTGLEVDDLSFSYDRQPVLRHTSFHVDAGDIVALTGPSGCGKSTLFSLLLGMYPPEAGAVRYFTTEETLPAGPTARKLLSYVPQGNALFSGTIRENIAMFRPEASEGEIWAAAKCACMDEFIRSLPQGLDTPLGEKGLGLSEGQAQRIAVARAIAGNAPVLLLDEATSALDEETEGQLLQNLASLHRTCLIVTHRRAALDICSRRIRLEGGEAV